MKKGFVLLCLLLSLLSCKKELESPWLNGAKAKLTMNYPQDPRGYYLVPINPNPNTFSRFDIFVEASELKPYYQYNGTSVIEVKFDSDVYWVIDRALAVKIPLYRPFGSLYTSPYFRVPLKAKDTTVILSQYINSIVPIVQESPIYLKEYFPGSVYQRADEYKPAEGMLWGKRIVGPVPNYMVGDTITIYSKIFWETGNYGYGNPEMSTKRDSLKIILK